MLSGLWVTSFLVRLSKWLKVLSFEKWYSLSLFILIVLFALVRCPYIYHMFSFSLIIIALIVPLYLSLFFSRMFTTFSLFISGFIPIGSPILLSPFVCIIELVSYIIRPIVLLIRPFVNISAGVYFGIGLGSISFLLDYYYISLLFIILFVYEIFVALMHWFIVQEILKFSVDH
uniref:ATPase subunit 6 n=1 Tax=Schistosoma mekongi TaxID=38744 RepID=Q9B8U8_SCHME|nr:ATP synthase F0 subunit 6 [Schistosoma mekongi]AAG12183.2 ATPase subunit 6 [Schistosoma mekongi]